MTVHNFSYNHMTESGWWIICTGLNCSVLNPEDVQALDDVKAPHTAISWTIHELAKTFPQASKDIRGMIKERKEKLNQLLTKEYEYKTIIDNAKGKYSNKETIKDWFLEVEVNIPRKRLEAEIKKLESIIQYIKWFKASNTVSLSQRRMDRAERVSKAKAFPLSSLIEVDQRGFARCIWHSEKTASMKYYNEENKVHCFGCGQHGDAIDVVRKLRGCSFVEAVDYLSNI